MTTLPFGFLPEFKMPKRLALEDRYVIGDAVCTSATLIITDDRSSWEHMVENDTRYPMRIVNSPSFRVYSDPDYITPLDSDGSVYITTKMHLLQDWVVKIHWWRIVFDIKWDFDPKQVVKLMSLSACCRWVLCSQTMPRPSLTDTHFISSSCALGMGGLIGTEKDASVFHSLLEPSLENRRLTPWDYSRCDSSRCDSGTISRCDSGTIP